MLLLPTLCRTKSFAATNVEGSRPVEPLRNSAASARPPQIRENVSSSEPVQIGGGLFQEHGVRRRRSRAPLTYLPVRDFFTGGSRNTPRVLSVCAGAFKRGAVARRAGEPSPPFYRFRAATRSPPRVLGILPQRALAVYVTVERSETRLVPEFPRFERFPGTAAPPRLASPRRATWRVQRPTGEKRAGEVRRREVLARRLRPRLRELVHPALRRALRHGHAARRSIVRRGPRERRGVRPAPARGWGWDGFGRRRRRVVSRFPSPTQTRRGARRHVPFRPRVAPRRAPRPLEPADGGLVHLLLDVALGARDARAPGPPGTPSSRSSEEGVS